MTDGARSENALNGVVMFLATTVPMTLFWAYQVGTWSYLLLVLIAVVLLCLGRLDTELLRAEKLLFFAIVVFYLVALVSFLSNEVPEKSARYMTQRYPLLLAFIPLYLLLRDRRLAVEGIYLVFALGAIAAGLVACYDLFVLGRSRAMGTAQPIYFGTISLAMVAIVGAGSQVFLRRGAVGLVVLALAVAMGLFAVAASGTRGAWFAIPFILLSLGLFYLRRPIAWVSSIVLIVAVLIAIYQLPEARTRIDSAWSDLRVFVAGEDESDREFTNTASMRLFMARAGWDMFVDNPVLGIGPAAFNAEVHRRSADDPRYLAVTPASDPHNMYLTSLATHGIFGFLALVSILGIPACLCIRHLRDPGVLGVVALSGCLLVLCYAVFFFTTSAFERRIHLGFYTFSLALLLGALHRGRAGHGRTLDNEVSGSGEAHPLPVRQSPGASP